MEVLVVDYPRGNAVGRQPEWLTNLTLGVLQLQNRVL